MKLGRSIDSGESPLSFVSKTTLAQLTAHAHPNAYATNALICEGRQLSEAAYVILSGGCELRRRQPDGSHQVFDRLQAGDIFGAVDEIPPDDAGTTAVASADSVILRIERKDLDLLRRADGSISNGNGNGKGNGNGNGHAADPENNAHATAERILSAQTEPPRLSQQVVTLAFLSEQVPAALISHQLAHSLRRETSASVVLVRFAPYNDANGDHPQPGVYLNGEFRMPAQLPRSDASFDSLTVGIKSEPTPASIASLFNELRRRFRYVLIEAPTTERQAPWVFELLLRSDLAYLFLEGRTEDVFQLERVVREVRERSRGAARHLKPIACLAASQTVDGFDLLARRVAAPVHMYVRYSATHEATAEVSNRVLPTFAADLRRLAREIGGQLVGLALSSGAAKGFAHIGVIQVLEENGIEVDVIAGSSMGAYVGSLWAYGYNGQELERLARELEKRWALWGLIDPVFPPRQGFMGGFRVKKRLMRSLGTARFADLTRPFRVLATNLETLERFVFAGGEVATAVHASIAVPGICVPIRIDGETYIDGGIADPLPVNVLREMGVSRIIAVDAIPTPDRMRYALEAERESARQRQQKRRCRLFGRGLRLDRQLNFFARGNLFEILIRSLHGAQVRLAEASCGLASLVLRPNICDDRWLDYRNPGKFMALGREVAQQHLDEIKALVSKEASLS